jgi:protoporphyrinogen oxidase
MVACGAFMSFVAPDSLADLDTRRIAIVGAGPTGLGAAYRLVELGLTNFTIFEASGHPGGLASSFVDACGFTWDVGGHVQFSHYEYFDRAMDRAMGDEWLLHDRESWIWIRDRFVPYPLQNNIHFLPDAEKRACLVGLLRRASASDRQPAHFAEWIRARFGDGIAETFLLPYNTKVWAYPPSELGYQWVGERVAEVDLERIVLNLLDHRADAGWGPNNQFRFPARGGTGEIWRRLAAGLPAGTVRYEAEVCRLDLASRRLSFRDGSSEAFDILVSTMPLDRLVGVTTDRAGAPAAAGLKYSTVHVVGVGLAGAPPPALSRKCWIYYPEDNCPYYRLTVFSNYSPRNVPDATRHWSVMVEVSESPGKPVDRGTLVESVIGGLVATRVIASRDEIVSVWEHSAPHGYPTPFLGRDALVDPLLEWFDERGVFSRGRFGAWKYEVSNQDHSFMQGVELVNRLAFGHEETTLCRPSFVNAGKR